MSKRLVVILVIILFIAVVVQAAVIIDYHSENMNLGFYKVDNEAGTYYKTLDENIRNQFFKPYEVQVRFDEKTLIVERDESMFSKIWLDSKSILEDALQAELTEHTGLWDRVCDLGGVTIVFGGYFPADYLEFMLESQESAAPEINIDKMMVVPGEDEMSVYLHTDSDVNYVTTMKARGLFISDNFSAVTELLVKLNNFSNNTRIDFYKAFGNDDSAGEEAWRDYVEPDIPINHDLTYQYVPYIYVGNPDNIDKYIQLAEISSSDYSSNQMKESAEDLKTKLLTKSVNLYKTHFDSIGNIFYTNQFNMYEISRSGWVNYRYTPGTEGDSKGSIGDAFINAYETLNTINNLITSSGGEWFVSRIEDNNESYTFKFDYKYNMRVLAIKDDPHAAVITSTATRTIEASVLPLEIRDVSEEDRVEVPYIFNTSTTLTKHNMGNINELEAYNIYIGYGTFSGNKNYIEPMLVFEKVSGEKETFSLKKGKE